MALEFAHGHAVVLIRQSVFEDSGITRSAIDERYNLTADEFRIEDSGRIGPAAVGRYPALVDR